MNFFARIAAVALLLGAGGLPLWGASKSEERAFNSASLSLQGESWERAEREFAQFLEQHPKSEKRVEALLCQAEARYQMSNYVGAAVLLEGGRAAAGRLADEYTFWLAQSRREEGKLVAAADLFAQLARDFAESPRAIQSVVMEAEARAKLKQWPRVEELLQSPDGLFQKTTAANPATGFGLRGRMLLAGALLDQGKFAAAESALDALAKAKLGGVAAWERDHLLARIQMNDGRFDAALATAAALPTTVTNKPALVAEGWALRGRILEKLNRPADATQAWQKILETTGAPADAQREALLRSGELLLAQGRIADSLRTLENFLATATNSSVADVAWLAIGELRLRQFSEAADTNDPGATNFLSGARAAFDTLLERFPGSALRGRAQLDRGWSLWLENRFAEAGESFTAAAKALGPSYERAVANFKLADVRANQGDFTAALHGYQEVVASGSSLPVVRSNLVEQALYQILRAAGETKDEPAAAAAMEQLLREFPEGGLVEPGLLAFSGSAAKEASPAARRAVMEDFLKRAPDSKLTPAVRLAIARTFEQARDWPNAIDQYTVLLGASPEAEMQARAEYYRALAVWHSGNDTNALNLFTNFMAVFPTNALAPLAQWWIAQHYFDEGDYRTAELHCQKLAENYPKSPLRYPAILMAGRAAFARDLPAEALGYFTNLTRGDTGCPAEYQAQALFASGDALMSMARSVGDTNELAPSNYREAAKRFSLVSETYTNSAIALLALGELGKCYFQLGAFDPGQYEYASNTLVRVIDSSASVAARSEAECLLAMVFTKQSQLDSMKSESVELSQRALDRYLNVVYSTHLRDGETADPFWVQFAGLKALNLAEGRQAWQQVIKLCDTLSKALPTLKPQLEKKRARAEEAAAKAGN